MIRFLIFVPSYNCESQAPRVVKKLNDFVVQNQNHHFTCLFVDNLSTDATLISLQTALEESPFEYVLIRNNENVGLGGSHKVAINYAIRNNFDFLIVLHGDDQGNIQDISHLLKNLEYQKTSTTDCWLGGRFKPGSSLKGYSKFRIFGNVVFNLIYSLVTFRVIFDLGAGLNVYRVSMFKKLDRLNELPNSLIFNCGLLLYTCKMRIPFRFFNMTWVEDDQISNVKLFRQSVQTLLLALKYMGRGIVGIVDSKNAVNTENYTIIREARK